jgi:hypothetical protein
VLTLSYGEIDFLFTGDAENEAEASILVQSIVPLAEVEILKVGQHGSRTASSQAFLDIVRPEVAIYMAGVGNQYGYPHEETISALEDIGAEIYGTDTHSTVVVETDGQDYTVITTSAPEPTRTPTPTGTPPSMPISAPAPTTAPAPTPPPDTGIPASLPEDVIPLTVPGFSFKEKSDYFAPMWEGEEYSAYSSFLPKAGSEFYNKVESLMVEVYLFEDEASAGAAFDNLVAGGTSSIETEVGGVTAILTYDEDFGEAAAIQQQGRLVIMSDAMPPLTTWTFDEEVLKDAAIEGLKAIRL